MDLLVVFVFFMNIVVVLALRRVRELLSNSGMIYGAGIKLWRISLNYIAHNKESLVENYLQYILMALSVGTSTSLEQCKIRSWSL